MAHDNVGGFTDLSRRVRDLPSHCGRCRAQLPVQGVPTLGAVRSWGVSGSWVRKSVVVVAGRIETSHRTEGGRALKHWLCFQRVSPPHVDGWTANRCKGESRVKHIVHWWQIPKLIEFLLPL